MAMNLKTLGVRSLTGSVFVMVLLGCLLFGYTTFALLFFVVSLIGLSEFFSISEKLGARPFKTVTYILAVILYFLSVNHLYLFGSMGLLTFLFYPLLLLTPFILMAVAMFSKRESPLLDFSYSLFAILYAVLPFCLLQELVVKNYSFEADMMRYDYRSVLAVILLIWSNDTFAYLGGSLFGKHKMIARVSPGKTWEGTLFGILVSFGISFLLQKYLVHESLGIWPVFGILVPVLATIGDLVESMLKRQAGIKDSGNLMPGHGGVLDRFDSLIFVSPFVVIILNLL